MGIRSIVREVLEASTQSPNRGDGPALESKGAYWCDDCDVRLRDVDVDTEPPTCPDCGTEMRFERSATTTGCAC